MLGELWEEAGKSLGKSAFCSRGRYSTLPAMQRELLPGTRVAGCHQVWSGTGAARCGQGQPHGEGGALARGAGDVDGAAVGRDERGDDGEAKAGAAPPAAGVGPPEALEDALLVLRRDAGALVGDGQGGILSPPAHRRGPACWPGCGCGRSSAGCRGPGAAGSGRPGRGPASSCGRGAVGGDGAEVGRGLARQRDEVDRFRSRPRCWSSRASSSRSSTSGPCASRGLDPAHRGATPWSPVRPDGRVRRSPGARSAGFAPRGRRRRQSGAGVLRWRRAPRSALDLMEHLVQRRPGGRTRCGDRRPGRGGRGRRRQSPRRCRPSGRPGANRPDQPPTGERGDPEGAQRREGDGTDDVAMVSSTSERGAAVTTIMPS